MTVLPPLRPVELKTVGRVLCGLGDLVESCVGDWHDVRLLYVVCRAAVSTT